MLALTKGAGVEMTATDAAELQDIGWHWDAACRISYDGETFTAARIGAPHHVLADDTATGLREQIRRDYYAWMASLREHMST